MCTNFMTGLVCQIQNFKPDSRSDFKWTNRQWTVEFMMTGTLTPVFVYGLWTNHRGDPLSVVTSQSSYSVSINRVRTQGLAE